MAAVNSCPLLQHFSNPDIADSQARTKPLTNQYGGFRRYLVPQRRLSWRNPQRAGCGDLCDQVHPGGVHVVLLHLRKVQSVAETIYSLRGLPGRQRD